MSAFELAGTPDVSGAALSSRAFNKAIPYFGNIVITLSTVFFALSTILGWAYYGEVSAAYLAPKNQSRAILIYRIIYVAVVFLGAVASLDFVWLISDCFNALMALPNLVALIMLSGTVIKLTKEHFEKNKPDIKE